MQYKTVRMEWTRTETFRMDVTAPSGFELDQRSADQFADWVAGFEDSAEWCGTDRGDIEILRESSSFHPNLPIIFGS